MAKVTIDEERLRELIEESVQKHLKLTFEDMEEVRRSPAAAIVRLETRLDGIEKNMATKAELANLRLEFGERIAKVETGQKIMFGVFLSMLGAIIAMLVKLVFFS